MNDPHTLVSTLLEEEGDPPPPPPPSSPVPLRSTKDLIGFVSQAQRDRVDKLRQSGQITAETADSANRFYHRKLRYKTDKNRPLEARRTGRTKFWKTRPDQFRIPVKYGMYDSFYIDNTNAHEWSTVPNPEPEA